MLQGDGQSMDAASGYPSVSLTNEASIFCFFRVAVQSIFEGFLGKTFFWQFWRHDYESGQ